MSSSLVVSDMDGTLTTADTWRAVLAWVREHHPSGAARRFVAVRLPRIAAAKATRADKDAFRARWMADLAQLLRGVAAGDLELMGEWVVERHLWPARREIALTAVADALDSARADDPSVELLLATGAYQPIADAFARRIGASAALGTPLALEAGHATGLLAAPTQSGSEKAAAVRVRAAGGRVVAAFGDTAADRDLLELAERAVAVAPDADLRRLALANRWEILETAR